jgi:hypothetical protein
MNDLLTITILLGIAIFLVVVIPCILLAIHDGDRQRVRAMARRNTRIVISNRKN